MITMVAPMPATRRRRLGAASVNGETVSSSGSGRWRVMVGELVETAPQHCLDLAEFGRSAVHLITSRSWAKPA